MDMNHLHAVVRGLRRAPLAAPAETPGLPAVTSLIPHRPPFLLIDRLIAHAPEDGVLIGEYRVAEDDPILAGHFPGAPVYPGTLQVEALAQLGACLLALVHGQGGRPVLTRVHHAVFLRPVPAGACLHLGVRMDRADPLLAIIGGQVCVGDVVHAVAVLEAQSHG